MVICYVAEKTNIHFKKYLLSVAENRMLSSFANLQMPKYRLQYQFHQKERELIHYIKASLSKTENGKG